MKKTILGLFVLGLVFTGITSYAETAESKKETFTVTESMVAFTTVKEEGDETVSITFIAAEAEDGFDYESYITAREDLTQKEKDDLIGLHKECTPLYEELGQLYQQLMNGENEEQAQLEASIKALEQKIEALQAPFDELLEITACFEVTIVSENEDGEVLLSVSFAEEN